MQALCLKMQAICFLPICLKADDIYEGILKYILTLTFLIDVLDKLYIIGIGIPKFENKYREWKKI